METSEKQFTPQESLQLIQEMIKSTKRRMDKESFLVLLWGYLATAGYLLGYIWMQFDKFAYIGYSWFILSGSGTIVSLIYLRTKSKKDRVKTYIDDCMKFTWLGYGITIGVFLIFLIKIQLYTLINPIGLILIGLPTFITGGVIKYKPLVLGGIIFWIFGALAFIITSDLQYILCAMAIVCGYLIPGYMLKANYKNETV